MIPELGQYALILALCMAIIQAVVPLVGTFNRTPAWVALARPVAWGQFFFLTIAFFVLLTFVIPKFVTIFVGAGLKLPLPTRICMVLYKFMSEYWYLLIGAVVAGILPMAFAVILFIYGIWLLRGIKPQESALG